MSTQPSLSVHENLDAAADEDDDGAADDEAAADEDGAADELLDAGAVAGEPQATTKLSNATSATNKTNFRILSPP